MVACTRRACEEEEEEGDDTDDPEEERNCRACGAMRADPVCGRDGRTYASRCFATVCRGLNASDIRPGPCSMQVGNFVTHLQPISRDIITYNASHIGRVW